VSYLQAIHKETNAALVSLKAHAQTEGVPIITDETARFLSQLIDLKDVKMFLEIGCAVAYNAIALAIKHPELKIITIERDPTMIEAAKTNIKAFGLESRITLIEGDALEVDETTLPVMDMIFIDAAKAQNIKFFEKFEKCLKPRGIIATDNVLFHDMHTKTIRSRNLKQLIRKIDAFNQYIMKRKEYHSVIHPLGDGLCLSIKQ